MSDPTKAELERAQKLGTNHNRMGPPGAKLVTAWDCDIAQALADTRERCAVMVDSDNTEEPRGMVSFAIHDECKRIAAAIRKGDF